MSLEKITTLKQNGTIQEIDKYFLQCKCSIRVFKKTSLRSHLKSKKHLNFFNIKECVICYEHPDYFWSCSSCKNEHCIDCHDKIRNGKCPFCRTIFRQLPFLEPIEYIPIPPPPPTGSLIFDFLPIELLRLIRQDAEDDDIFYSELRTLLNIYPD